MKVVILNLILICSLFANDEYIPPNEPAVALEDPTELAERMENFYVLKLHKRLRNGCRVAVFASRSNTHFIPLQISRHDTMNFNKFMKKKNKHLRKNPNKIGTEETFGVRVTGLHFSMNKRGELSVAYSHRNELGKNETGSITLEEKYNCGE